MRKFIYLLIPIMFMGTSSVFADEASHKKAAQQLFDITMKAIDFEQMQVDSTLTFFRGLRKMPIKTAKDKQKVELIEKVMEQVVRKWSPQLKLETGAITTKLYMQVYTEDDLNKLVELFNSKIGLKYLKNSQFLTTEIVRQIIPKTKGMTAELQVEIPKTLAAAGLR